MAGHFQALKLAKMQQALPTLLSKARACAAVVMALASDDRKALPSALTQLKAAQGPGWALSHALQFMSGQQAEYILEYCEAEEKQQLQLAHLLAKYASGRTNLGRVNDIKSNDLAGLKTFCASVLPRLQQPSSEPQQ